jgi:hypothetical protein
VEENLASNQVTMFMSNDKLFVSELVDEFKLYNNIGQEIPLKYLEPGIFLLPNELPQGVYLGFGTVELRSVSGKIVID